MPLSYSLRRLRLKDSDRKKAIKGLKTTGKDKIATIKEEEEEEEEKSTGTRKRKR